MKTKTKQTTRTETESEKWTSHGGISVGRGGGKRYRDPAKLSFRMEGYTKYFPDKVKLKEFIITNPLLYETLKGLI